MKNKKIDMVRVIAFAKKKHKGQKYEHNTSYFDGHLTKVFNELVKISPLIKDFKMLELAEQSALLHDVLEDTDATKEEIIELTKEEVYEIVYILTKQKKESYLNYLIRVLSYGGAALLVKYADLTVNISTGKIDKNKGNFCGIHDKMVKHQRLDKYELARYMVVKKLYDEYGIDLM